LAEALHLPLATHCAPALSAHLACAVTGVRCVEHFFDHAQIESLLFEGAAEVRDGALAPDLDRRGHGLKLRQDEARRFASERT
jgi:L-alanine-DL-glutamate epimerase-like enolase superfamily enzyme